MVRFVTGNMKIVKVPAGEAPLWVREAWVGLVLPIKFVVSGEDTSVGVLSKKKTGKTSLHYSTEQDVAISTLGKTSPKAETWWRDAGFPEKGYLFTFQADEVEIVGEIKTVAQEIKQFLGILELGIGAHDGQPSDN